jgi:opacity protein-like surface antigen
LTNDANNGNGIHYEDLESNNAYNNWSIPWLSILGWDGYLIDRLPNSNNYYGSFLYPNERVNPKLNVSERGNIESYDFTVGTSFSNKLYLGATLTFTDLFYSMRSTYSENPENGGDFALDNFLETEGSGYQLKIGAIYRPIDALRLGVSYHSPTWYSLTDFYWGRVDDYDPTPDDANTRYRFQTPSTWTFSAAAIIGTEAILSADYEVKDYTTMNLKDMDGADYEVDNGYIADDFKSVSTLRIGLEYRFTPQFSGRLGYSYQQSPYQSNIKAGETRVMTVGTVPHYTLEGGVNYLTAGIGYRFSPSFYIDFAFVSRNQKDDLYFYSPFYSEYEEDNVASHPASYKNKSNKGLLTFGYKF